MTDRVDLVTLNVEFCCGYAGVIIGIRWNLSVGLILGSQTGNPRIPSSICFSNTGFGHSLSQHSEKITLKKFCPVALQMLAGTTENIWLCAESTRRWAQLHTSLHSYNLLRSQNIIPMNTSYHEQGVKSWKGKIVVPVASLDALLICNTSNISNPFYRKNNYWLISHNDHKIGELCDELTWEFYISVYWIKTILVRLHQ